MSILVPIWATLIGLGVCWEIVAMVKKTIKETST